MATGSIDGSMNLAAVQAVIDNVWSQGGGQVTSSQANTYTFMVNGSATDGCIVMRPNVSINLNGSLVNIAFDGTVYGFRPQNNAELYGGTIVGTSSANSGSSSMYHALVALGATVGEVTDVNNLGNYLNASGWNIHDLTLVGIRAAGSTLAGICGAGGTISGITFPSNANTTGCVNFDWGTVGTISSFDLNTSKTNFLNGTAYTVHPNNITISDITIGDMPNATGVRISGCNDIAVSDVSILRTGGAAYSHIGGDLGYELALDRSRALLGNVFTNCNAQQANGGFLHFDALADNIEREMIAGTYTPIVSPYYTTDFIFNGKGYGPSTVDGITARYNDGGTLQDCILAGFSRGLYANDRCYNMTMSGGEVSRSASNGVFIGSFGATTVPSNITIDGVTFLRNTGTDIYAMNGSGRLTNNKKRLV